MKMKKEMIEKMSTENKEDEVRELKRMLLPAVIQNLDYYLKSNYREAFESYMGIERLSNSKDISKFASFVAEQMAIGSYKDVSGYESDYYESKPIKTECPDLIKND
jgi:hypothetical protein